ncbi:MAG: TldD/PmbA family protein [Rhodospirillales bacterium]|nr:TldD/PmbA family protein [Rhodospirillales bacterium]
MTDTPSPLDLAGQLVERALAAGADSADATAFRDTSLSVNLRLGELEELERSESNDMGLRVFVGQRQAAVSTTDASEETINELVSRAVAMAWIAPEDEFAGLADADLLTADNPDLDLDANDEPAPECMIAMAAEAEDAARAVEGVTNSEGASVGWHRMVQAMAASNGFQGSFVGTSSSVGASVIAGEGLGMERDGDYRLARHMADLPTPAEIGAEAARRAVRKLNPQKLPTRTMPVVFEDRQARSLIGHFIDAISGPAIARGTSFLKDCMGEQVFAPGVNLREDPHRVRGLRSRPFDGEGLATSARDLVADGKLTTWLLDCRSARQLGLQPTGHATRGTSGQPSPRPSNLWLEAGTATPEELMADIEDGLYCTDLIGFGVNGVTGDYSRGAGGFRIENGEITHPVNEITIASNLRDMYANLVPANDLKFLFGTDTPHVRIDGMTVAGR